jgi:DNA-binding SARP family transcriptional activator
MNHKVKSSSLGQAMPNRSNGAWTVRVGSVLGLVSLAMGVPALLLVVRASSPWSLLLQAVAYPINDASHSLGAPPGDLRVVDAAIVVAWLTWAWLLACVIAELAARARGKPTARFPVSRHVQGFVALLVSASVAIFPTVRIHTSSRVATSSVRPGEQTTVLASDHFQPVRAEPTDEAGCNSGVQGPGKGVTTSAVDTRDDVSDSTRPYVVQVGDTMWSIAGRELNSPLRWREIAALNVGRVQTDGQKLTEAGWILPGWVLRLPISGGQISGDLAQVAPVRTTTHSRDEGEAPSAGRSLSKASKDVEAKEAVSDPEAGRSETSPDPTVQETSLVARPRSSSTLDPTTSHPPNGDHTDSSRENHRNVPLAPFGYGLLGAGVVVIINRLRRAQQRHRPTGRRIALPEDELVGAEQMLRSSADHSAAAWIDACLRILVASCHKHDRPAPSVVAVRVLEHTTELVLGARSDVDSIVEPFEPGREAASWILPRESQILEEARVDPWIAGMDVISPALVTIGREHTGLLLVDIEQAGSVSVSGGEADGVIRAIAIELATAQWSEQVSVVLVGMERPAGHGLNAEPALDILDRVRIVGDAIEVLPEMRHIASERELMLTTVGERRSSDARMTVSGDGWDVTVVCCSSQYVSANPKAVSELVALAGDGARGVAVVCATDKPLGTKWHLTTGDGPVTIGMAGMPDAMVWPQTVDDNAGDQIARLVDVARRLEGVEAVIPPYHSLSSHSDGVAGEDDLPAPTVEIRVLGPVEVLGAARPFTRAWSLELVVYLAMHPGGASSDQWATHLWPSRSMAQASLHSTASAARRALGSSASGEDHLPRSHGRLVLGPEVGTDWDRFCRLASSEDPDKWKLALQLVRGRPFDGLRSTDWAVFSHVQANIESLVVDIAARRSEHCLVSMNPSGAEWAARQGLLVSPYDERLFRLLMRAADLAGNPSGVEAVMAELLRLVGDDVEPYDSVHPETYDLYRSLSRRQASSHLR